MLPKSAYTLGLARLPTGRIVITACMWSASSAGARGRSISMNRGQEHGLAKQSVPFGFLLCRSGSQPVTMKRSISDDLSVI